MSYTVRPSRAAQQQQQQQDPPHCSCHQPATLKTVRKQGVNHGRLFYTCDVCNFIQWASPPTSSAQHKDASSPARSLPHPIASSGRYIGTQSISEPEQATTSSAGHASLAAPVQRAQGGGGRVLGGSGPLPCASPHTTAAMYDQQRQLAVLRQQQQQRHAQQQQQLVRSSGHPQQQQSTGTPTRPLRTQPQQSMHSPAAAAAQAAGTPQSAGGQLVVTLSLVEGAPDRFCSRQRYCCDFIDTVKSMDRRITDYAWDPEDRVWTFALTYPSYNMTLHTLEQAGFRVVPIPPEQLLAALGPPPSGSSLDQAASSTKKRAAAAAAPSSPATDASGAAPSKRSRRALFHDDDEPHSSTPAASSHAAGASAAGAGVGAGAGGSGSGGGGGGGASGAGWSMPFNSMWGFNGAGMMGMGMGGGGGSGGMAPNLASASFGFDAPGTGAAGSSSSWAGSPPLPAGMTATEANVEAWLAAAFPQQFQQLQESQQQQQQQQAQQSHPRGSSGALRGGSGEGGQAGRHASTGAAHAPMPLIDLTLSDEEEERVGVSGGAGGRQGSNAAHPHAARTSAHTLVQQQQQQQPAVMQPGFGCGPVGLGVGAGSAASAAAAGAEGSSEEAGGAGGLECVICLSAPRTVGLLHGQTMHLCVCRDCSKLMKTRHPCPICRTPISKIIHVFT